MSTQKSLGMSQLAKVQIEMLEDEDLAQGLVETDYAQKQLSRSWKVMNPF